MDGSAAASGDAIVTMFTGPFDANQFNNDPLRISRPRSLRKAAVSGVEPLTLAEAKAQCRVDTSDDDAYITALITCAREYAEDYCDMTFVPTQYVMRLDAFPATIEVPRPPMAAAGTATGVTITYTLGDTGATATMDPATYRVDRDAIPGTIRPPYGGSWPAYRPDFGSISVTWWAGTGSPAQKVKNAMLMLVDHWYGKRSAAESGSFADVPYGVKALLDFVKWGRYA